MQSEDVLPLNRRPQFHLAPVMYQPDSAVSRPLGWIFKTLCEKLQSLSYNIRAQELCESRGDRPGLSVLTSLMVSVDVMQY